jgi:hypothetical protein
LQISVETARFLEMRRAGLAMGDRSNCTQSNWKRGTPR